MWLSVVERPPDPVDRRRSGRWFARTFRPLDLPPGQVGEGQLYVRRGPRPPGPG